MSRYDVIVLGGGIIGCALAEELARRGQRVAVVERGRIGAEASSAAAGILSAQMDLPRPGALFELCQAARRMYPRWVAHLEQQAKCPVGYHRDGLLALAMTSREALGFERQARWQRARGLRVERWSPREIRRHEPAVDGRVRCGFSFPLEAQVDNVRLMEALVITCRNTGVRLLEGAAVQRILITRGTVRGVETDRGRLVAAAIVNCLGSWANLDGQFPIKLPVVPVRGQMLAFQAPKGLVRRAIMSSGAYVVQRRGGWLIAGSTLERAGFEKTLTVEGMQRILCGVRRFSRALDRCRFMDAWAGFRPCTPDQLPILGMTSINRMYVATGHYRHGILLAPITATLMAELMLDGRTSLDLSPFAAHRFC